VLEMFRNMGRHPDEAEALRYIAEIYNKTNQHQQAREYCEAALQIARRLGIPLVKECEELLLKIGEQNRENNG
jgi:tetratricopeptide (TPR) repeat protein